MRMRHHKMDRSTLARIISSAGVVLSAAATTAACSSTSDGEAAASTAAATMCLSGDPVSGRAQTFSETGKTVRGIFLDYRDELMKVSDGMDGLGLPITDVFTSVGIDGKPYDTQCFERRVLEYHPENACDYRVLGRQLGRIRYKRLYPNGAPGQSPHDVNDSVEMRGDDDRAFRVSRRFFDFWNKTGGLRENGIPLSDELEENGLRVQYFERAVFEYHPENGYPYDVLGTLLGNGDDECNRNRSGGGGGADVAAQAEDLFQNEWADVLARAPNGPVSAGVGGSGGLNAKVTGIPGLGKLCDVLKPFADRVPPFFYYGAYVQGGAGGVGLLGTEEVLDLKNLQSAVFWYKGGGVGSQFGAEVGTYVGWAWGDKANVIDAWAGPVGAISVSAELPWLELGAGVTYWTSLDHTVNGGAVAGSFGLDVLPTPVDAFATVSELIPWNMQTDYRAGSTRAGHSMGSHNGGTYIQFNNRKEMASYILTTVPQNGSALASSVAAGTLAISIARDFGGSSKVCNW